MNDFNIVLDTIVMCANRFFAVVSEHYGVILFPLFAAVFAFMFYLIFRFVVRL